LHFQKVNNYTSRYQYVYFSLLYFAYFHINDVIIFHEDFELPKSSVILLEH
jgi:hypothetical protein